MRVIFTSQKAMVFGNLKIDIYVTTVSFSNCISLIKINLVAQLEIKRVCVCLRMCMCEIHWQLVIQKLSHSSRQDHIFAWAEEDIRPHFAFAFNPVDFFFFENSTCFQLVFVFLILYGKLLAASLASCYLWRLVPLPKPAVPSGPFGVLTTPTLFWGSLCMFIRWLPGGFLKDNVVGFQKRGFWKQDMGWTVYPLLFYSFLK